MIGVGEILVIDDFISLEYQEKLSKNLSDLIILFLGITLKILQVLVIMIVNIEQHWVINM